MASARLPGFLRRSLRIRYDDDDENDEEEEEADEGGDQHVGDAKEGGKDGDNGGPAESSSIQKQAPVSQAAHSNNDAEEKAGKGNTTGVSPHPPDVTATSENLVESNTDDVVRRPVVTAPPNKETIPRDPPSLSDHHPSDNDANHDSWQQVLASNPPATAVGGSTNLSSSQADPPPKPTWREVQMQRCLDADVVSLVELRKLAWNGIPNKKDRALAWKLLLGYAPTNKSRRDQTLARKRSEYLNTVAAQHYHANDDSRTAQDQETLRQVLVDVPRTAPDIPLFRNDRIKRMLSRLLYSWAMRHPASSYVQGINDVATPLIVVFLGSYFDGDDVLDGHVMHHLSDDKADELEADVYWCLTNLLSSIQDHYTADQPGVQRMVKRLEELTNRIDHALCQHLRNEGVEFLQFSFKWMNCLLLREFHLRCVPRLWDTYLAEKSGFEDFHVYVCAAFLCQFSSDLQGMPFDRLFGFFQEMPTATWTDTEVEMLLSQAYVLSTLFGGSDAHLANTGAT